MTNSEPSCLMQAPEEPIHSNPHSLIPPISPPLSTTWISIQSAPHQCLLTPSIPMILPPSHLTLVQAVVPTMLPMTTTAHPSTNLVVPWNPWALQANASSLSFLFHYQLNLN